MATKRYRKLFLIHFLAYFAIFTGLVLIGAEFGPVTMAEFTYRKDKLLGKQYQLEAAPITDAEATSSGVEATMGFSQIPQSTEGVIKPASTEFGIVIEKINANAVVVPQIDPADEQAYINALSKGVAEAKGSTEPGKPGNLYLFSHSTDAPWNVARYNAVFYLLRELEPGDKIAVFYKGKRYNYIVYDKSTVPGNDTSFLQNRYDKPVLTLQTCDPPGTVLNRLLVRAKLAGT